MPTQSEGGVDGSDDKHLSFFDTLSLPVKTQVMFIIYVTSGNVLMSFEFRRKKHEKYTNKSEFIVSNSSIGLFFSSRKQMFIILNPSRWAI